MPTLTLVCAGSACHSVGHHCGDFGAGLTFFNRTLRWLLLAKAIAPNCEIQVIGIRPGEKLHEVLLSEDEARHSIEQEDRFVIVPAHPWWKGQIQPEGKALPDGFRYDSETNTKWLSEQELLEMAGESEAAIASASN